MLPLFCTVPILSQVGMLSRRAGMLLNYIIPPRISKINYYMERISIELANLFGIFADVLLFFFLAILFCSLILWIVLPIIEFRKKNLLKKIYAQLVETQDVLRSINRRLARLTSSQEEISTQEIKD